MQQQQQQIPEGKYTSTVYRWVQQEQWQDAIALLSFQLQLSPTSRAALSLLAYCYYHTEQYESAAPLYQQLTELLPDKANYRFYHAMCLFRSGETGKAREVLRGVKGMDRQKSMLLANMALQDDDVKAVKSALELMDPEDSDAKVMEGCLLFREEKYEEAQKRFETASPSFDAQQVYNAALCCYRTKRYGDALKLVASIIERGIREHPELGVGSYLEESEMRSVGNSLVLRETAIVEALNLKAAIEFNMKNVEQAREVLKDLPPRQEEEVDAITLHNSALVQFDEDTSQSFRKLNHLLQNPPYPPEAFQNLLLLCCRPAVARYNLVADMMAENPDMAQSALRADVRQFLQALIARQESPETAHTMWDAMADEYVKRLRQITKRIQDSRNSNDNLAVKKAVQEYDEVLEMYLPVLMGMGEIHWHAENWPMVEKIFKQSAEFCSDQDVWQLNVAHVLFREEKWEEAIRYYQPLVRKELDDVLRVPAIVLANLCVAYIMTNQNIDAEELMKRIERDEERAGFNDREKSYYHLCIVNLTIGTLYCAKGNFEFGILRVIKALEPYAKRLSPDTWLYAKRCFVAMLDNMAKLMIVVRDATVQEMMAFLEEIEKEGKTKYTTYDGAGSAGERRTIASEARLLRQTLLRLTQDAFSAAAY